MRILFAICLSFTLLSIVIADRAPHGLVHESPVVFSPSAKEFFQSKEKESKTKSPCSGSSSSCSSLPFALQVETTKAKESRFLAKPEKGRSRLGAGAIAGIVIGSAFAVLLAMGGFYVFITRRVNTRREKSVQSNV